MKNQYFGDVNDYLKYGLLRGLGNNGQYKIGVCWMLTADDNRPDGKFTTYLNEPQRWRHFDPPLFDLLQQWIISDNNRSVMLAQDMEMLPCAEFHSELISDSLQQRTAYFKEMKKKLAPCDLIFFDPDNGLEIKSAIKGRKNSAKFVYWDEISEIFKAGHSVLIYQHFRREERTAFIQRTAREIEMRLNPSKVYGFKTSHVSYFLAVQEKHSEYIASRVEWIKEHWDGQIILADLCPPADAPI